MDLRVTLAWLLAGAPTIIHVDLNNVLAHLVVDTHYRNQFECVRMHWWCIVGASRCGVLQILTLSASDRTTHKTGTSGGALCKITRTRWEDSMFASSYADATPFQRVKYGALNVTNCATGIRAKSVSVLYNMVEG